MYGSSDDYNHMQKRNKREIQKLKKQFKQELTQLLSAVNSFERYVKQFSDPVEEVNSVAKLKAAKKSANKLLKEM